MLDVAIFESRQHFLMFFQRAFPTVRVISAGKSNSAHTHEQLFMKVAENFATGSGDDEHVNILVHRKISSALASLKSIDHLSMNRGDTVQLIRTCPVYRETRRGRLDCSGRFEKLLNFFRPEDLDTGANSGPHHQKPFRSQDIYRLANRGTRYA
ncbi:hypothetical protein PSQ19_17365 [Devosia algicola]|uniref:Uncharacterized protein n=1 Tax=Devosia algicola TaxID=3026418 RepID=A0ABY7YMQ1_9HYPH|nr:hypothetical protein [Devosia algicola]WDR02365.1 hypothetical protein PSQ19_17365 [Devosia algicola]